MSHFDHLPDTDKARHALEAINRVLAGSRLREYDAAALEHAAELVAVHVPRVPHTATPAELDFLDRLALGQERRGHEL